MAQVQTSQPLVTQPSVLFPSYGEITKKSNRSLSSAWKEHEKIVFRFAFIYFIIQAVPLDWKYYRDLLALDWTPLTVIDFFYLARYVPRLTADVPVFTDWLIIALVALGGTFLWSYADKAKTEYNDLYYALRVVLRFRLAVALLAYGFLKFYPLQMPEPSLSNLNTNYGDLTAWKIFSMSVGIVPEYESFLGLTEILAALLLLYRRTASMGAFIALPFLGNIFMSNLAYEGEEYVYSLLLITFASVVFAFDFQRLAKLTSFEKTTSPNTYRPTFNRPWQRNAHLALKGSFIILFVFVLGYKSRSAYHNGGLLFPATPGLSGAEGVYNVEQFKVGQQVIAPSATNADRWRDVVFEKWNTLSVRLSTKQAVVKAGTTELFADDSKRNYEYSETSGRKYFTYTTDTSAKVIHLTALGPVTDVIDFNYTFPDSQTIQLEGKDVKGEVIEILLRKIDKKYLLEEAAKNGRRKGLKL